MESNRKEFAIDLEALCVLFSVAVKVDELIDAVLDDKPHGQLIRELIGDLESVACNVAGHCDLPDIRDAIYAGDWQHARIEGDRLTLSEDDPDSRPQQP